jgi:hypothetical protein
MEERDFDVMTDSRQGEDAASYLHDVATSRLYLNNAFRVTGLDITATLKEAKKHVRDREQCRKLGIAWQSQRRAYFPISSAQTIEDIRIVVDQKLANPYRRLIEELFWFWPNTEENPANDEALSYLSEGHPDKAKITWIAQVNSHTANLVPLHNLAVLNHLQALECEQEIQEGGCQNLSCPKCHEYFRITAAEGRTTIDCPNCQVKLRTRPLSTCRPNSDVLAHLWRDAHDYWSRLWISAAFWAELSLRAKNIDAILGLEIIDQVKKRLPEAILSVNVGLSIDYCSHEEYSDATRHGQLVFSSNFSEKYHISAIRHATARMIDQIHQQATLAEKNADSKPESGLQEASGLLEKTSLSLKCFEILDFGLLKLGHAACDAVASTALSALINYQHKTHDCESLIKPTEDILNIAKSESLKNRIVDNLTIIKNIVQQNSLESNIKPIFDICEQIDQAIEISSESDTRQPYVVYARFQDEVIPKLNEIKTQFGETSEVSILASKRCAYCLRGISIALNNRCHDLIKAFKALQWAGALCHDQEFRDLYAQDLRTLKQNAEVLENKPKTEDKSGIYVFIGIVVLFLLAQICKTSSTPSQSSSLTSTTRPYTYTPPPSRSSQQSTVPSSVSGSQSQSTPNRSNYPGLSPSSRTASSTFDQSLLRQQIESGKARLRQMETQIGGMDKQLESYESDAQRHKLLGELENYNNLVPLYNALVGRRNQLYAEYESLFNEVNAKIKRYNAQK